MKSCKVKSVKCEVKTTRKKKLMKLFLVLFPALNLTPYTLNEAFASGKTGAAFLKVGVGARPAGMGGAFTAIANDVTAIHWNPAGLTQLSKREISAMHNEWIGDLRYDFLGYVHPIKSVSSEQLAVNRETIGISVVYLSMGEMERRGERRERLSDNFSAYDFATTLTYSRMVGQKTGLGLNLKFIQQKIEDERAFGVAVDLGTQLKVKSEKVKVGFVIQNLGPKMRFIKESYSLPLTLSGGAGYDFGGVTLALDFKHQVIDSKTALSLGTEYWPLNIIALRAGYLIRLLDKAYGSDSLEDKGMGEFNGLGAGLGLRISGYQLDYSLVPYGDLGQTHRISFSAKF